MPRPGIKSARVTQISTLKVSFQSCSALGVATTPVSDPLGVVHMEELEQAVGSRLTWARLWEEAELGKVSGAWYLLTCWLSLYNVDGECVANLPPEDGGSSKAHRQPGSDRMISCKGHGHTHAQRAAVTGACELPEES